ncbi:MAG TPA: hypothetical protein PLJ21_03415 [Pseudobdellovibrionaceae bacterium]|nr:hypothetical protein [Pseudobdellovibrionaceae bacterium]
MNFLKILTILTTLFLSKTGWTQDSTMTIVDVRRNITMSDEEIPYKDFYISIASSSALKVDQEVSVFRKINIRDAAGAQSYGEIKIPVAKLKIIATFDRIAVAREVNLLSREKLPMLENFFIMSGDEVQ